jgi:tetratricopeptide (TPR) repeat protein
LNFWIICTFLALCSLLSNFAFSQQTSTDEALFVRRILEFWRDKESTIVKSQINQFIETYPSSSYVDSLLVILGDTFWNEKKYVEGLQAYGEIKSDEFKQKVFNNRLDCLYRLERYKELIHVLESKLAALEEKGLSQEQALWVYFKAEALLQMAKQNDDNGTGREQYEQASHLFRQLLQSSHRDNAKLGLIEIELRFGNQESAANYYLELAEDVPEKRDEMLLQAAQLQATYSPQEAMLLLEEIQNNPQGQSSSQAVVNKLILLFEKGDYQRIIDEKETLESRLEQYQRPILDFYIGRSCFALKQYEEAIAYLQPLLKAENHLPNHDVPIDKTIMLTIAASAHQLNDLSLINNIAKQFEINHPHDPSFAKILYLRALTYHHRHQLKEALSDFQQISNEYPDFEQGENVLFEIGLLLYKSGELERSRVTFMRLIEQTPESPASLGAMQYLPSLSVEMLEKAEERGEACDALREQLLMDLQQALDTPGVIKPTQKSTYLLKIGKVYYDMQKYNAALNILNQYVEQHSEDEHLFHAHLLLALCHREGLKDSYQFAFHAEKALEAKPEFSDQCRLRLNLFSTYLQLAKSESDSEANYTDKAVEHLYKVFKLKSEQIKSENQLWLADHFYNKVKATTNEYIIDVLNSPETVDLAQNAISIYQSGLKLSENESHAIPITEKTIYLEHELFKLSNLYGWLNSIDKQIKILDHLISLQQSNPSWKWTLRTRTVFAKANALKEKGDHAAALEQYSILMNRLKSSDLIVSNATKLQWSRLYFASLPEHKRTIEDGEMMAVLKTLKDLQIRKSLAQEPIHLEAALDYAMIRSSLEPEGQKQEQFRFLLKRIKEDFTNKEDLWSKDYHAGREQNPIKDSLYQSYMMLIDAHLAKLEAQLAEKKGDILDKEAKQEAAQAIYANLLTSKYAVTKYLINQAQVGLENINKLE